jgi:hypothetical protein
MSNKNLDINLDTNMNNNLNNLNNNLNTNIDNNLKNIMVNKSQNTNKLNDIANSGIATINSVKNTITNSIKDGFNTIKEKIMNGTNGTNQITDSDAFSFSTVTAITIIIVLLLLLFFLSKTFRVSRTMNKLDMYLKYINLTSYDFETGENLKLSDSYIASSYNSIITGYQMFDYTSSIILQKLLKCGVRFFDFTIFNSEFGEKAIPVVSNGYREGEWKLTIDYPTFEECIKVLSDNAFTLLQGDNVGVPNPDDPLFISLNLNTNNNLYCLDLIAEILVDNFRLKLLSHKYSYQQTNIADISMYELKDKVCIFSSDGFQGSKLEEIVNYSWNMKGMRRVHYSIFENEDFNIKEMIEYNKNNITIVVPHKEGDILSSNYNPLLPYSYGCQFVLMNYHIIDSGIDNTITKFKEKSIIPKPKKLRTKKQ